MHNLPNGERVAKHKGDSTCSYDLYISIESVVVATVAIAHSTHTHTHRHVCMKCIEIPESPATHGKRGSNVCVRKNEKLKMKIYCGHADRWPSGPFNYLLFAIAIVPRQTKCWTDSSPELEHNFSIRHDHLFCKQKHTHCQGMGKCIGQKKDEKKMHRIE